MARELDLGIRLRFVRESAGLSQRQLAKKAGITNSTISLIEANRTNPSIGALKRVLDAIPIGIAEFFSVGIEEDDSIFFSAEELLEIGKGSISYRQVGKSMANSMLQMLSECYQPGADTGCIPLSHEGEEAGVVLSGRLEVTVNGERRVLRAGDAYRFDSHKPHRFRCVGNEPACVISACTPPSF